MTVRRCLYLFTAIAAFCVSTEVASAQTSCSGSPTITCTMTPASQVTLTDSDGTTQPVQATNGYPAAMIIPGTVTGTIGTISVRLNGLTASATAQSGQDGGVSNLGILLVYKGTGGPKNLELMYAPGDATVTFSNVTFNIADTPNGYMPSNGDNCLSDTAFPSQSTYTYRPSSFKVSNALGTYPSANAGTINRSGPCFATTENTLNGVFGGVQAAGEWDLYIDDTGFADVSLNSWSLIFTTAAGANTTTTLTSSVNPSFTSGTSNSTTLTATVTSSSTVNTGSVVFSDNGTPLSCSGAVSAGVQTCNVTFTTQGFHALSAAYSSSGAFGPSTGTINQFVEFHPTISGTQFCNSGPITVGTLNASNTDTQPYGSIMNVTGIPVAQSVSTVQLVLNGVTMSETVDLSMLLVSPDGNHALDFFDFVGGGSPTSSTSVTFSDSASGRAPQGSGGLAAGNPSYQPTSYNATPSFATPPAPAPQVPASFSNAPTGGGAGAKTFLEAFNGAQANGSWGLYIYDHGNPNTATISGGWCLTITPGVGSSTLTTVSGSPNAAAPNGAANGTTVTVTAVVKSGGVGVTAGSVVFTENGKQVVGGPSTAVAVGTSGPNQGKASFTTASLPEGDHIILATFTDSSSTFAESFGSYVQRVDNNPMVTVNGSVVTYCNGGKITVPDPANASDLGAGTPNPSNIHVGNLPGTVSSMTLTLKGFNEGQPNFLTSVLVGPAANKAATLDFLSGAGGSNPVGPFDITIADGGSALSPGGALTAGTFKPGSFNLTDTFTASLSGLYTLPGTYDYSASTGTSTLTNSYVSKDANGNWDLYFYQTGNNPGGGLNTGWCLNLTENAVTGTGTTAHVGPAPGNDMVQGGTGSVTFSLLNNGDSNHLGSTGDPDQTVAHAMAVVGTLPSGLTVGTLPTGSPWNCSGTTTITCTSMVAIGVTSTYPLLTIPVNVTSGAPTSVTVSGFTFSGAGMTGGTFSSDTITINATPSLSISKTPSGTFTQGSTATWNITVSNVAPNSTTSGTVTVIDTLPNGYSLNNFSGTGWSCGAVTVTVTCMNTTGVAGGSSYSVLALLVNVPPNSPTSVTNNAVVFGGGDSIHTNSGNGATTFSLVNNVVQVPATITLTGGNNQSVAVTTAFPINFSVTVVDAGGIAINNASVTFTAPATGAGGTFAGATNVKTTPTNSSGLATATVYTASATAGAYSVSVTAGSATNSFSATNLPGPATQMTALVGTATQTTTISTAFANGLGVTVKDASNNLVSGLTVTFTAPPSTGASGVFSNGTRTIGVVTDGTGVAFAPFTANGTAGGPYTVTATATGPATVNFSLTNAAAAASTMSANAGTTPQTATISTAFTNALAVTVKDSGSNPVSGVSVTFTAPVGASGIFSNNSNTITVATNPSGIASAPFTANGTAGGPYTVTAVATGLTTVNFSLTNATGAASSMTANVGTTPQTATISTAFANALAVTVKDSGSNPVSGVSVTFTVPLGSVSGTFSNNSNTIAVSTNPSGVASAPFTASATAGGPYTVTAAATGLTTVNFSLTNATGAASSMTANAGTTPQTATVGTAFANALSVTVKDSGSNPVSGVSVTFTAPLGASGIFSNSSNTIMVATNPSGVASAPITANLTAGGPYTVTAAATGLTTVNFSLTNSAAAVGSMTANAGTTPQTATVGTAFTNALAVTVRDAGSAPVSGVNVTFTAPSGASGTFSNGTTIITVATNPSGIASAPITANTTAGGPYTVTAAASGLTTVNFSLTNSAAVQTGPTVVSYSVLWGADSYNMLTSTRNRLPWQITGIRVVFSAPITTGNVNSLSGTSLTTTGFTGLGTNTLTWTISPLALGNFPTTLAGSGPNALQDGSGNALTNGAGFSQNLKILLGDFNDDGIVNSLDLGLEFAAISSPYNIFADTNGDGLVSSADYSIVRTRSGTTLP
jgi:subtilisin-like proprotein convertase family protein